MKAYFLQGVVYLALLGRVVGWAFGGRALKPSTTRKFQGSPVCMTCAKAEVMEGWNSANQETFVSKYLQKQPILIRNAFPDIQSRVKLNFGDFSELAADEDVETRVFTPKGRQYAKEYGPFNATYTESLQTRTNWSMLIQEVDRHIPHVADLWSEGFGFMPNWRRDDIMFSYSTPGGSIGAHVDNYDVFLLQGSGQRRWAIENKFVTAREEKRREVPRCSTRLLKDFSADQEWVLNPGDMLYLPPRIPHQGVTVGDTPGTTVSVGFRAPDYRSVVTALWEDVSNSFLTDDNAFYKDEKDLLGVPVSPGEISSNVLGTISADVQAMFLKELHDKDYFHTWLGRHLTAPLRYRQRKPSPFFLQPTVHVDSAPSPGGRIEGDTNSKIIDSMGGEHSEEVDHFIEIEEEYEEEDPTLPFAVRSAHSIALPTVFADATAVLQAVLNGECALRRAEGLRVAHVEDVLYIDGEAFYDARIDRAAQRGINIAVCDDNYVSPSQIGTLISPTDLATSSRSRVAKFFKKLLELGYLYPVAVRVK